VRKETERAGRFRPREALEKQILALQRRKSRPADRHDDTFRPQTERVAGPTRAPVSGVIDGGAGTTLLVGRDRGTRPCPAMDFRTDRPSRARPRLTERSPHAGTVCTDAALTSGRDRDAALAASTTIGTRSAAARRPAFGGRAPVTSRGTWLTAGVLGGALSVLTAVVALDWGPLVTADNAAAVAANTALAAHASQVVVVKLVTNAGSPLSIDLLTAVAADRFGFGAVGGFGVAAQVGADAGVQFGEPDRFGQVVIGACFQSDDDVHLLGAGGQDDDHRAG
jgi:hypothetical protein